MGARWILIVTAEDGAQEAYGPRMSYEKARDLHDAEVAKSGHYGGEGADYEVSLLPLRPGGDL